jgi:hypothetical protein
LSVAKIGSAFEINDLSLAPLGGRSSTGCLLQRHFVAQYVLTIVAVIRVFFRSRTDTALEILALRQQVAALKRKRPGPALHSMDRLFWTALRRFWSRWSEVLVIVKPETVVGWRRAVFRLYWRWLSRSPGRPRINDELREVIKQMGVENPGWGAPRIHGELQNRASPSPKERWRYLRRIHRKGNPVKRWLAFLRKHRELIIAV